MTDLGDLPLSDPIPANEVTVADSGGNYTATDVEGVLAEIASSGSGSSPHVLDVNQTAHGLDVGDVVRLSGANYVLAQADSVVNAEVVGIVIAEADADNFTLQTGGLIEGLSGLTAGVVYYLSDSTPGALTSSEPADEGEISKPILIADTTTSGWLFNMRGFVVSSSSGISPDDSNLVYHMELMA
jgi:hypothetical protein